MKKFFVLLMAASFLFSCQGKNESAAKKDPNSAAKPEGNQQPASGKTLNFSEIRTQEIQAKGDINMGSAESFPFTKKGSSEEDVKMVKFSYFLQENKLVQSKDVEKTKGYCELSATATANANGAELNLVSEGKLSLFGEGYNEKRKINNLNYEYNASFYLTLQYVKKGVINLQPQLFTLECFNVFDLAELKSTAGNKFTFTEREKK